MGAHQLILSSITNIHCVGIGGIGVSAIARLFTKLGKRVTGSDVQRSIVTNELERIGIRISIGPHRPENIPHETELVIYTAAAPPENLERQEARRRGLENRSYPEALGELMIGKEAITVSGTHGKTTVTAMIGHIFVQAGLDPTIIVGSRIGLFDGNERLGRSPFLIAEACEWRRHFLHYPSRAIVLTNIEPDHLDYFRDLDDIVAAFRSYVEKLPSDGLLIANADDPRTADLARAATCRTATFGIDAGDARASRLTLNGESVTFQLPWKGETIPFTLQVPGRHNVLNALAAAALSLSYDIPPETVSTALASYRGAWRRFEVKGEYDGATVIDDYAHHPTEIRATLAAARSRFPGRRIIAVFQPHHRNRTLSLFDAFASAFADADLLFLAEIYDVAGREGEEVISSRALAEEITQRGKRVAFYNSLESLTEAVQRASRKGDIIIVMGAGDVTNVAGALVQK